MTAQLIDGNALAKQIRAEVAERAAALRGTRRQPGPGGDPGRRRPGLARSTCATRSRPARTHGLHSVLEKYDASLREAELLARIAALNADPAIHGILVQMPLPAHIDPHKVIEAIAPAKDVDGFSMCRAPAS